MDYATSPFKKKKDQAPDMLSDLPLEITENILTRLPIREAIKTSILSSKWRYRWVTLPCVVFDDEYLSIPDEDTINSLSMLVTQVLLLHKGPIHKFRLFTPYYPNCLNLEQWLLSLSREDIRELSLRFHRFRWGRTPPIPCLPSFILSYQLLTSLELGHCELNPPPAFEGFSCLKCLLLKNVSISRSGLEHVVSHSPLLEIFLWSGYGTLDMVIHAPKLRVLTLCGKVGEVRLEHSPLLAKLSIGFTDNAVQRRSSVCKFVKFLGGLSSLVRLSGYLHFIKVLGVGIDQLHASVVYNRLRFISLRRICLKDIALVPVILRLMTSSPKLCDLTVNCDCRGASAPKTADVRSWDTIYPSDCTFKHLKVVKLTELIGLPEEMKFIEFMLSKSPALKSLVIKPCEHLKEGEGNMLQESVRFHRASRHANVLLLQP